MIKLQYKPASHVENRMKHEGDVGRARNYFLDKKPGNLQFLLKNRFEWMNRFIKKEDIGIEVGAGTGLSKMFINCNNYKITDFANNEWLDEKNIDALNLPYEKESMDFIMCSNMIHHVASPLSFFNEVFSVLKPNGYFIIQEIQCSWLMRRLLKLMRHEGYDFNANVFDINEVCTDPNDLWSANCAIPSLLFDDEVKFHENISNFKIVHQSYSECLMFVNSGGVIAKTASVPLPNLLLSFVSAIDSVLVKISPNTFALQRQIVLQKC